MCLEKFSKKQRAPETNTADGRREAWSGQHTGRRAGRPRGVLPRAPYRSPHQEERPQRPPRPVRRGFGTPSPPPFPAFSLSGPRGPYERRVSPPRGPPLLLLFLILPREAERGGTGRTCRAEPRRTGLSRRSPYKALPATPLLSWSVWQPYSYPRRAHPGPPVLFSVPAGWLSVSHPPPI